MTEEEQAKALGMPVEVMLSRRRRIQSETFPQFGHAGRHRGNGAPDCPREMHHHHDDACRAPTPLEWAMAGRQDEIVTRTRA